jgi:hypothetical protein
MHLLSKFNQANFLLPWMAFYLNFTGAGMGVETNRTWYIFAFNASNCCIELISRPYFVTKPHIRSQTVMCKEK